MSEADQAQAIRRLLDAQQKKASPFTILQLDVATCEVADVNRSFRKTALLLHPDRCKLPRGSDAFRVAETAHKLLSDEAVLAQLKRAEERRREREAETATSHKLPAKRNDNTSSGSVEGLPVVPWGSLCKLAPSGSSSDDMKAAEIARILSLKPNDYFTILDVNPAECEAADVVRRYRRMAQALHPDKCSLPRVNDAFTVFERAHRELSDEKKLVRFRLAYEQNRKRAAALQAEAARRSSSSSRSSTAGRNNSSCGGAMTAEERLAMRKEEALREHQLRAARLADEAARKRQRVEEEAADSAKLAADLERQRKEWRDMELF